MNLSTAGQDDSSSEEAQSNTPVSNGKPAIPPRPRSISIDHKRNGGGGLIGLTGDESVKKGNKALPFEEMPCKDSIDIDNTESMEHIFN